MQTEVKKKIGMTHNIADLSKEFELRPGTLYGVLNELGIENDGLVFEAEGDELELVRASLGERAGSNEITVRPNPTPRDLALALGVPQQELQKVLVTKFRVMAKSCIMTMLGMSTPSICFNAPSAPTRM